MAAGQWKEGKRELKSMVEVVPAMTFRRAETMTASSWSWVRRRGCGRSGCWAGGAPASSLGRLKEFCMLRAVESVDDR